MTTTTYAFGFVPVTYFPPTPLDGCLVHHSQMWLSPTRPYDWSTDCPIIAYPTPDEHGFVKLDALAPAAVNDAGWEPVCLHCYNMPFYNEAKKDYIDCPSCGSRWLKLQQRRDEEHDPVEITLENGKRSVGYR